jgi:hypothetical protein
MKNELLITQILLLLTLIHSRFYPMLDHCAVLVSAVPKNKRKKKSLAKWCAVHPIKIVKTQVKGLERHADT